MIKQTVNNNTLTTNSRSCHCKHCGTWIPAGHGKRIMSRNTYAYICQHCATAENGAYTTENGSIINNQTKTNNCTISIENEVPRAALNYNRPEAFAWLINEASFLKTPDCTVWAEFKSPIYNNLLGMSKVLNNFEKLNKLSNWNNDITYGTHLNIGNPSLNLAIIERFYHSLFFDFSEYLRNNPTEAERLHGRSFSSWAQPITINTDTQNHTNFVNMQHRTHIEFRLCKLVTAKQYLMLARFYQDLVQKILVDYFLKNYAEAMTAADKKRLAKKASLKMIKLYKKYLAKLDA